jgi:hypothetical protein
MNSSLFHLEDNFDSQMTPKLMKIMDFIEIMDKQALFYNIS